MPQRIRRCILHIGTEKTGTTSLQRFLATNRTALLQRGFFVPASLSPDPDLANHESLTTIALDPANLGDDGRVRAGLKTIEDVKELRVRVEGNLSREIVALSHQPENSPTLLLSNEHCHSRLVTREEVHYLRQFLESFADEMRIVVYLRPQHEVAISVYDQALKVGYYDIDVLPDFTGHRVRCVDELFFEYDKLLERWAGEFGRDKITVRLYSKEHLEGNDVIQDFMSVISCNSDGLQVPARENVSLSAEYQTALNAINRFVASHTRLETPPPPNLPLPPDLEAPLLQRDELIPALEAMSSGPGKKVKREDAIRFFHAFDDCNEQVRKGYFSSVEPLFRPNFNVFPVDDTAKTNEIDAAVRVILAFFKYILPALTDPMLEESAVNRLISAAHELNIEGQSYPVPPEALS
jgi:hypothetical protein